MAYALVDFCQTTWPYILKKASSLTALFIALVFVTLQWNVKLTENYSSMTSGLVPASTLLANN
jgi:hypothetical protein